MYKKTLQNHFGILFDNKKILGKFTKFFKDLSIFFDLDAKIFEGGNLQLRKC